MKQVMSIKIGRYPLVAAMFLCLAAAVWPQTGATPAAPLPTSAQIVQEMTRHNQLRADQLKHYSAVRRYQVDYKGFGASFGAKMEVAVNYDAPAAKSFRIMSTSGSKLLIDKVLKRLIETEKQATGEQSATALTTDNYSFQMEGTEALGGRPAYVLSVTPLTQNKLLYRGKIWVDAADFAVAKIEAQPAKNPSMWIARTEIRHTYAKTGAFWLPEQNRSESKVRIGGTAVLTIDYGTYQVDPSAAPPVAGN
jgi:hypothetical protein